MRRSLAYTALAIAGGVCAIAAWHRAAVSESRAIANAGVAALHDGQVVRRRLGRGDDDLYRVALAPGEYLHLTVEQRSIDVLVRTREPGGAPIAAVDDEVRLGRAEEIDLAANAAGDYTIAIQGSPGSIEHGEYEIRVGRRRTATATDRARQDARALRAAAARLQAAGRFDDARTALERTLVIVKAAWGSDDVQVAAVLTQLAGVYRQLPDAERAEAADQEALAIMTRAPGADAAAAALIRVQLAELYQRQGDRARAEQLLRQSMDVLERTLGQTHPWFVRALLALGNLRDRAGDLEAEEAIVRRALSISERIGDTSSLQYAELLNNLGEVYRQKRDYFRAEELFDRSLALAARLTGSESYSIATAFQNLGIIERERKDYVTAEAYNLRALEIRERAVGDAHPDVAHILINLGNIYRATGDYERSLETDLHALEIWERSAGPYQEATLLAVGNIARTYAAMGDIGRAVAYQRRADAILERQLTLNMAVGSERQKLAFVRSAAERTDRTISLHLQTAPHDPKAGALAALVLLQRKGRVQDAMTDMLAAVRRHVDNAGDGALLGELNATTAQLAHVALSEPDGTPPEQRRATLERLEREEERLEAVLSEHSAEFRVRTRPVSLESVQSALPSKAALLEYVVYRPFDPQAERNAEAYGAPRYAVYVIRRGVAPEGLDLGPVAAIAPLAEAFRAALRDPARSDVDARAVALGARVLDPVRPYLAGASQLLVSPDGELNLVPFEALHDGARRYLVERYTISYLTSGRDLLRLQVPRARPSAPVIVADPVFGDQRGGPVYFAQLAATAAEGRAIKSLFPGATLWTGREASKAAVQQLHAPLLLHIASHGFFVKDGGGGAADNPLLRSGLALAGANVVHAGSRAGILTALEASRLDLWGTRLVTLSACDTGVGEVQNGEGVYGLRRAFELAGAETLVMTLWPVNDYVTRDAMIAYYTGLRAGLGRAAALRRAKLAVLRRGRLRHPYYWAGFIQSGEWANLQGQR